MVFPDENISMTESEAQGAALNRFLPTAAVVTLALLLAVLRALVPERPLDLAGPRAILDTLFALGLLVLLLALAIATGRRVMHLLGIRELTALEQAVFGTALGLGLIAYGILCLGLAGLFYPWAILSWLLALAIWTRDEWGHIVASFADRLMELVSGIRRLAVEHKAFFVLGLIILLLSLMMALAPPWDYDGLMYHLQAPKLFLRAGRIYLLPDLWQANGPFTIEMLFSVGLAFGSDSFPKLVNLTYGVLLATATYALGRRLLGVSGGWRSAVVLLGVFALPFWSSLAYVDLGWAAYEFLALYLIVIWINEGRDRGLILGAMMMGFALGTKYLALGSAALLAGWVLWHERKKLGGSGRRYTAVFLGIALIIGSPWYIKNWIWGGNPVYPLWIGGYAWDQSRVELLQAYLGSFGTGDDPIGYLLLPVSLYRSPAEFGTLLEGLEMPSLLFPLAIIYPFFRKQGIMNGLATVTGLRFLLWAVSSQQTRFLLPLFPTLSVITVYVLHRLTQKSAGFAVKYFFRTALPGGMLVVTLLIQVSLVRQLSPFPVLTGIETKEAFLEDLIDDFKSLQVINRTLPPNARVLMLWDGQGYYCDDRCLPDAEQGQWTLLVSAGGDLEGVRRNLDQLGVTHLLLSQVDAEWLLSHDPSGKHQEAFDFLLHEFIGRCGKQIYADSAMILYEVACETAGRAEIIKQIPNWNAFNMFRSTIQAMNRNRINIGMKT